MRWWLRHAISGPQTDVVHLGVAAGAAAVMEDGFEVARAAGVWELFSRVKDTPEQRPIAEAPERPRTEVTALHLVRRLRLSPTNVSFLRRVPQCSGMTPGLECARSAPAVIAGIGRKQKG